MDRTDFTYCNENLYELEEFGFKIHISATINNYKQVFDVVSELLEQEGAMYKYLSDVNKIYKNFSETESLAESGKFITIYPRNREDCIDLLEKIYQKLPYDLQGIYILSDRNYKNSNNIFYRFGCNIVNEKNLIDGFPTMYGPDGEIWQDYQKVYFDLPKWVEDIQEPQIFTDTYMSDNYEINSILKSSNGGNIYLANQKESTERVIIKECRNHILSHENIEKRELREKEWIISSKFIKYSPKPLEKINEWTNGYFIYEFIDGVALKDFVDDYNLYFYSKNDITKNYFKFLTLLKIFEKLIELVGYFHQENIVLNDIHPDNIIITNMLELYFVDLENSYLSNESPLVGIYNDICLEKWNYIEGKKADCYKIANLILFLLGRLQLKGERDCKIDNIKELLLQKGIDTNIDILIKYLFSDEPDIFTSKKIFSHIYVRKNKEKRIDSWINTELLPLSNQEFFNLLESRVTFSVTKNIISAEILALFNNFRDFGLEGLSGFLIFLHNISFDKKIINKGVEIVLSNTLDIDGKKFLRNSSTTASPYLLDGTAGIIRMLLYIDPFEYKDIILDLSSSLLVEYAQFSGYWGGMIGLADTLLAVCKYFPNDDFISIAKELLISEFILQRIVLRNLEESPQIINMYKILNYRRDLL